MRPEKTKLSRRVVTGIDEEGMSTIWLDDQVPEAAIFDESKEGQIAQAMWATDEVPSPIWKHDPMIDWFPKHNWFPETGLTFGVHTWQPGVSHPLHVSETIDVGIILSGEIELILERGSTILKSGDCFVQRATMHGWEVIGDKPCTFVVVLIAKKQDEKSDHQ
jgi:quercetin dioxygenase-like cupin family protein